MDFVLPFVIDSVKHFLSTVKDQRVSSSVCLGLHLCNDVASLISLSRDVQQALEQFAPEFELAGITIGTSKSEAMVLSWKRVGCPLQIGSESLPVKEFKYLDVLFMSGR